MHALRKVVNPRTYLGLVGDVFEGAIDYVERGLESSGEYMSRQMDRLPDCIFGNPFRGLKRARGDTDFVDGLEVGVKALNRLVKRGEEKIAEGLEYVDESLYRMSAKCAIARKNRKDRTFFKRIMEGYRPGTSDEATFIEFDACKRCGRDSELEGYVSRAGSHYFQVARISNRFPNTPSQRKCSANFCALAGKKFYEAAKSYEAQENMGGRNDCLSLAKGARACARALRNF